MEEGRHEGKGEKCQFAYVLKFDGKSNWKAFYAKFSRYAEVGEWTEGNAGTSCAGAWMGKLASIMPYWWNETMIWHTWTSYGN